MIRMSTMSTNRPSKGYEKKAKKDASFEASFTLSMQLSRGILFRCTSMLTCISFNRCINVPSLILVVKVLV